MTQTSWDEGADAGMDTAIDDLAAYDVPTVLGALGLVRVGGGDWGVGGVVYRSPRGWGDRLAIDVYGEPDGWPTLANAVTDLLQCVMEQGESYADALTRIVGTPIRPSCR